MSFSSENVKGSCPMFMAGDPKTSPKGLIVLQEWWGMNEQIKEQATELSKNSGFVTLVPDLYRGKLADDREEAGHLMQGLDWKGAVQDIQGAAKYLLENGCKKVGVTGFCMGGALSLAAAALVPEISAAAPFYGIPSPDLADVSKITIPVQGHFGELDELVGFSSAEDAKKLKEKMGEKLELFMYKDCNHAFTNTNGPNYKEEMSKLAQTRMIDFMKSYL